MNLFYGLYYTMTGLHGLHVLVGIIILCIMYIFVSKEGINKRIKIRLKNLADSFLVFFNVFSLMEV